MRGHPKKIVIKGGPSTKNKGEGGSRKILPLLEGGRGKKFSCLGGGGVMQLSSDTSKKFTSPPYFVKNERSLSLLVLPSALRGFCVCIVVLPKTNILFELS